MEPSECRARNQRQGAHDQAFSQYFEHSEPVPCSEDGWLWRIFACASSVGIGNDCQRASHAQTDSHLKEGVGFLSLKEHLKTTKTPLRDYKAA